MMHFLFFIPLTLAIITAYLFQKTTQEIAYLTATTSIVSLIVSLFIAPWQVQLIIISVAIIMARVGRRRLQETETSEQGLDPDKVRPTAQEKEGNKYRGVNYDLSPMTANISLGKIDRKYRGNPLPSHQLCETFIVSHKPLLKYRGVEIYPEDSSLSQES